MTITFRQEYAENLYNRVGDHLTIKTFFMKKYLLGLFAVVLAVGFSAFNKSSKAPVKSTINQAYYVYDDIQAGPQNEESSYTTQSETPLIDCPSASTLCWFKVEESENFIDVFNELDKNKDGQITAADLLSTGGEDGIRVELRN